MFGSGPYCWVISEDIIIHSPGGRSKAPKGPGARGELQFFGWDFWNTRIYSCKEAWRQWDLVTNYLNQWRHYQTCLCHFRRSLAQQIFLKKTLCFWRKAPTSFHWWSILLIYYSVFYFPFLFIVECICFTEVLCFLRVQLFLPHNFLLQSNVSLCVIHNSYDNCTLCFWWSHNTENNPLLMLIFFKRWIKSFCFITEYFKINLWLNNTFE